MPKQQAENEEYWLRRRLEEYRRSTLSPYGQRLEWERRQRELWEPHYYKAPPRNSLPYHNGRGRLR